VNPNNPATAHRAISEVAAHSLGAKVARLWVSDPAAGVLRASGSFGVPSDLEAALLDVKTLPYGAGIPGRIFNGLAAEFITDAHDDPRWENGRYIRALGLRAYAGLPLIVGNAAVGVLSLLFSTPREFTEQEQVLARALADAGAIAVGMGPWVEDTLTRLANTLAHELNNPLTVVMGHLILLEGLSDREAAARAARARTAADRIVEVVRRLRHITRLEPFRHTSIDLPPMFDIWRSDRD